MGYERIEQDLTFIRETMEKATRYKNIPAAAYLTSGLASLAGTGLTYLLLGKEKAATLADLASWQVILLAFLWLCVLAAALATFIHFTNRNAQKQGLTAWSSLARRMFFSQLPLAAVAGVLTLALALAGQFQLIPALWLMNFGIILFSFSYFAGPDNKVHGLVFILLGVAAALGPSRWALPLLLIGFGGVQILFGLVRLVRTR